MVVNMHRVAGDLGGSFIDRGYLDTGHTVVAICKRDRMSGHDGNPRILGGGDQRTGCADPQIGHNGIPFLVSAVPPDFEITTDNVCPS